ncbi:hypothetical protein [Kibdelosporangium philippinense]|uniref:hypothetical protein n=1 Tax=Kibdelosporangium philippinense TaxID=211113 RepID=UPI003605B3C2
MDGGYAGLTASAVAVLVLSPVSLTNAPCPLAAPTAATTVSGMGMASTHGDAA